MNEAYDCWQDQPDSRRLLRVWFSRTSAGSPTRTTGGRSHGLSHAAERGEGHRRRVVTSPLMRPGMPLQHIGSRFQPSRLRLAFVRRKLGRWCYAHTRRWRGRDHSNAPAEERVHGSPLPHARLCPKEPPPRKGRCILARGRAWSAARSLCACDSSPSAGLFLLSAASLWQGQTHCGRGWSGSRQVLVYAWPGRPPPAPRRGAGGVGSLA